MFKKTPPSPRKPLRERVADRKAGRAAEAAPKSAKSVNSRKLFMRAANAFQVVGVLIMLYVVMRFTDGNLEYMEELIGIAAGFFLTGRVAILVIKNS